MSNKNWGFHASVDTGWQGLHLWWSPAMLGIPMLVLDSAWMVVMLWEFSVMKTIHALATISNKSWVVRIRFVSSDLLLLPFWGRASLTKLLQNTPGMILSTMHRGVLPVVQNYWVWSNAWGWGSWGAPKTAWMGWLLVLSWTNMVKGDSRNPQWWDPLMVSFPYHSHTIPISLGIPMGLVWEAYQQGVPSLGVPENPTETCAAFLVLCVLCVFWWCFYRFYHS